MILWCLFVTLFYLFANVLSSPIIQCKISDAKCLETAGPALYAKIFQSDPKIGTESLDPMHHDLIEGNLSLLKFKLTNSTVEGLKDCKIQNFKINPIALGINVEMLCPRLNMYGNYEMSGRLITLPIEGTGNYKIISKTYRISLDIELKVVQEKNGNSHISMKNFRVNGEPLEPVTFDFANLFNGQKDLAETVLKFANENWKEVSNEVQSPILYADFRKIIKNANKIFKTVKLEDLIQF